MDYKKDEFPSIDETLEMLDDIADEIPKEFFRKLNKGIILLPEYKLHKSSCDPNRLYIMGEYSVDVTGRQIRIYYGSFKKICQGLRRPILRQRLKDVLLHEFTHHLESMAGEKGLEIKDAEALERYMRRNKPAE